MKFPAGERKKKARNFWPPTPSGPHPFKPPHLPQDPPPPPLDPPPPDRPKFRCFCVKRAHLRAPALQTPPKFYEKTPRKTQKENGGGEEKKKRGILGPPPFGTLPFGPPTLQTAHPSGPPPFGPPPFRGPSNFSLGSRVVVAWVWTGGGKLLLLFLSLLKFPPGKLHTSVLNLNIQQINVACVKNLSTWRSVIWNICWSAP